MSRRRNLSAHGCLRDRARGRSLGGVVCRRERGQAMVEFTLVIIPVLLICFAIVHPFSSAQDEDVWTNTTPVYGAPYLQDRRYEMHIARDGHEMTFASMNRPLKIWS